MNEILPPRTPGKGVGALIGLLIFVVSTSLSFVVQTPTIFFDGSAVALISLFFAGYRYIFVGFILTFLISIGLAFLALCIICGSGSHSI